MSSGASEHRAHPLLAQPVRRRSLGALPLVLGALLVAGCARTVEERVHAAPARDESVAYPLPAECAACAAASAAYQAELAAGRTTDCRLERETHLAAVWQRTFGGENAEAYWSFDDRFLILQATRGELQCDQIFTLEVATGELVQLTSSGRATCAYFLPASERVLFASTHAAGPECPPEPDRSQGYVWPLFESYEIYTAERDGSGLVNITNSPGYDAEATVALDGRIVFTSVRSGDLELWTMDATGGGLRQLTDTPGYDGGAFFSRDGSHLVWRASRFDSEQELADYRALLQQGLVRPSKLDIWVADADGTGARRLTDNGKANFAPFFSPDGRWVLFATNVADERGRVFDIWRVPFEGGEPERITFNDESFDGFPMFSWCGRKLAFSSNRFGAAPGETNVFVADWVP